MIDNPISTIREARAKILALTGYLPNKLRIGRTVWDELRTHPDVLDRLRFIYTGGGILLATPESVGSVLGIEIEIVEPDTVELEIENLSMPRFDGKIKL